MSAAAAGDAVPVGRWRGSVPALRWLRSYEPGWFRADLAAGVTLAAYLLTAALGDSSLAGLPPEAGLYACLFGGLVFWLFCSSRQTSITVTSAISRPRRSLTWPARKCSGRCTRNWQREAFRSASLKRARPCATCCVSKALTTRSAASTDSRRSPMRLRDFKALARASRSPQRPYGTQTSQR